MQFAGSSSTGDRRRRRLVVNGDGSAVDALLIDGDGAEMESQLVASAAAGPWVPVTELRIWIYASIIGLLLAVTTFARIRPISLPNELNPLADHLMSGDRPRLLVVIQTAFLALSAQLGLLIGWYRSQCKLDFAGRYRVWPWAVALCGLATLCSATEIHQIVGEMVGRRGWFVWRGETVSWLLPICLMGLPIALLVDRDVRNSRSSLLLLRFSGLLWLAGALIELYRPELQSQSWFSLARQFVPIFASAILFVGMWLHARIVAFVCPDPPKLEEKSAWSLVLAGASWFFRHFLDWKQTQVVLPEEEIEEEPAKPKRRRKKTEENEVEEVPVKRKRKAAPKKTTTSRSRSRPKPTDLETEESEESTEEASSYDETDSTGETSDESLSEDFSSPAEDEQWNHEEESSPEEELVEESNDHRRIQVHKTHASAVPPPHSSRVEPAWQADMDTSEHASTQNSESDDENSEDNQLRLDSGMTSDQFKGLSKRQRRELKKQQRDQERARGR